MRFRRPGGMCKSGRCAQPRRLFPVPSGIVLRGGGRPGPSCFTRAQYLCPMRGSRGGGMRFWDPVMSPRPAGFLCLCDGATDLGFLSPRSPSYEPIPSRSPQHRRTQKSSLLPRNLSLSQSRAPRLFVAARSRARAKTISATVSWAERKRLRLVFVSQARSVAGGDVAFRS